MGFEMRKIIVIGECALDIIFPQSTDSDEVTARVVPAGRLLNGAAALGDMGHTVTFMGETGRDFTGDLITGFLERHGVETRSIDRYTGAATPVNLIQGSDTSGAICMRSFPEDDFDDIWPRVDEGDIIVFGSFFAISARSRKRLMEFLSHCNERKAIIMYLPGFLPGQSRRITHEMPLLLENLETADIVITRTEDLKTIFKSEDDEAVYRRHIDFYCRPMINFDRQSSELHFFYGKERVSRHVEGDPDSLKLNSLIMAHIADRLIAEKVTKEGLDSLDIDKMERIIS